MKVILKSKLIITLIALIGSNYCIAQCNSNEYTRIFNEAIVLQEKGEFIEAKNRFEAAKIYACNKKEKDATDEAVDRLFEEINQLRQEAQTERDRANTLAGYFQFKFNRSWAFKDGKYAIIDTKGLKITDFIFNSIKQFNDEGYAEVQIDGQEFIIDTMGVISEGYTKIDGKVYKGLRKVERNGKFSYVDKTGSRPNSWGWYDYVELFSCGLGFAYKDDTLIVINRNGIRESILNTGKLKEYEGPSITLRTSYGDLKYIYESPGFFMQKKESKNKKNEYEIKIYNPKKELLYTTSSEYLYFGKDIEESVTPIMGLDLKIIKETRLKKYFGLKNVPIDFEGVLNHQGVLLPTKFKSIYGADGYNTLSFGKDGLFKRRGFIHRNGKIIINPYRYPKWKQSTSNFRIEEFRVYKKSGVVNRESGEILIQPIYKDIFFTSCESNPYIWYRKNRKWGLLSPEGKVLTKPMYKIPLGVRLKEDWGNSADYPTYSPCDSSEMIWVKRGHRWTVINGSGTELFAPIKIKEPNRGGYWLKKGNKFALMYNRLGEFNTPFTFKHVIDFMPGQSFTFAWNNEDCYIVDTTGKYTRIKDIQLSPNINFFKFHDSQRGHYSTYRCYFYGDIIIIPDKKTKSYVIIDKYGNVIDRSLKYQDDGKKFFHMSASNDSTIRYSSNSRINSVFIIHKNGKIKFEDTLSKDQDIWHNLRNVFDSVETISYNGLCVVGNKNKFGIVNSSGEPKTSISYSKIEPFYSNGALFYLSKDDEQWYIINSKFETYKIGDKQHDYHLKYIGGESILEVEINGARGIFVDTLGQVGLWVEEYQEYENAYIKFKQNGKWGVSDIYGRVLLKPDFDKIDQMKNGMAVVNIEDLFGYVNDKWEYVIPAVYDRALSFMPDGMASVVLLGNSFFVDKNGKIHNIK